MNGYTALTALAAQGHLFEGLTPHTLHHVTPARLFRQDAAALPAEAVAPSAVELEGWANRRVYGRGNDA